ncbi:MAG TPA: DUF4395 domain-containing protein [Nocardioidaceae bacterium]|nr:DUF4395 domain-containing protein [Nocardioidaceae bacterium]
MPDPGTSPTRIDPRGPRFAATLTTLVLAVVLLTAPSPTATALLVVQAALFAAGALGGIQRTPYAWLFKRLVRPRLGPPGELEDAAPPRFAQTVGLAFALVALTGFLTGVTVLGLVATGFALAAAFLNAAFGFCLGCELYLLVRQALPNRPTPSTTYSSTTNPQAG